jgi:hypothetical protein
MADSIKSSSHPNTGLVVVNPDGSNIFNSMISSAYDYIGASYPDTSTEVYTYKVGGSGGTVVGTITVVYSDAVTKQIITSVSKT